mmetsp:Transcript_12314/g.32218  ORF Transcript_12314/g.32218 Transcript_12314/m.32218 type:complete len:200 (-) Transcript_12314:100-699(-)
MTDRATGPSFPIHNGETWQGQVQLWKVERHVHRRGWRGALRWCGRTTTGSSSSSLPWAWLPSGCEVRRMICLRTYSSREILASCSRFSSSPLRCRCLSSSIMRSFLVKARSAFSSSQFGPATSSDGIAGWTTLSSGRSPFLRPVLLLFEMPPPGRPPPPFWSAYLVVRVAFASSRFAFRFASLLPGLRPMLATRGLSAA